jgi:hypothetical protein
MGPCANPAARNRRPDPLSEPSARTLSPDQLSELATQTRSPDPQPGPALPSTAAYPHCRPSSPSGFTTRTCRACSAVLVRHPNPPRARLVVCIHIRTCRAPVSSSEFIVRAVGKTHSAAAFRRVARAENVTAIRQTKIYLDKSIFDVLSERCENLRQRSVSNYS